VIRSLVPAIGRSILRALTHRSAKELLQCIVIPIGLGVTASGFVVGSLTNRVRMTNALHQ
jgi:hypothetical protein